MTRLSRTLALLMVLQACLVSAMPAGVLCVSRGDHVALETTEWRCCQTGDHAGRDEHGVAADSAPGDSCGLCVDVTLPDSTAIAAGELAIPTPPAVMTAWAPVQVAAAPLTLRLRSQAALSPTPPPALQALRTVVLTC